MYKPKKRAHAHLVSPGAESLDDCEVVALAHRKPLPRLVCPSLLAERPLERCLVALPCVLRGCCGVCALKVTNEYYTSILSTAGEVARGTILDTMSGERVRLMRVVDPGQK